MVEAVSQHTLTVLNGPTILKGESLSDALDCSDGDVVRLTMPADWTDADISFAISSDDIGYNNLHAADGKEIVVAVHAGTAVVVPVDIARAVGYLKIRSGTSDRPVPQEQQRTFAVAVRA